MATKVVIGLLTSANFAVPLYALAASRELWDEPMAVLTGNLCVTSLLIGLLLTGVGSHELTSPRWMALCQLLQAALGGAGVALKAAQTCMALDQLVAVRYPLHHRRMMRRALRWMLAATATSGLLTAAANFGLTASAPGWPTPANGSAPSPDGHCTFQGTHSVATVVLCGSLFIGLAMTTTGLLAYTGVMGFLAKLRLMHQIQLQRNQDTASEHRLALLRNFKAFKRVCLAFSLTLTLDFVGPIVAHIAGLARSYPSLLHFANQLHVLSFIIEGWLYGLTNVKIRTAFKKRLLLAPCAVRKCSPTCGTKQDGEVQDNVGEQPMQCQNAMDGNI